MNVELRVVAGGDADVASALESYFAELDARFPHGFDPGDAVATAVTDFDPPNGLFVIAYDGEEVAGCGGLSFLDSATAEIKRMWIAPRFRGRGLARRLLRRLEEEAVATARARVVLDTNGTLLDAIALYESSGYVSIDRYNDNPYAERWFAKDVIPPTR